MKKTYPQLRAEKPKIKLPNPELAYKAIMARSEQWKKEKP